MKFRIWLEDLVNPLTPRKKENFSFDTLVLKVIFTGDAREDPSLEDPEYMGYVHGELKRVMRELDFYEEEYVRGKSKQKPPDDWILQAGVHLDSMEKEKKFTRVAEVVKEMMSDDFYHSRKIMRKGSFICYRFNSSNHRMQIMDKLELPYDPAMDEDESWY